MHAFDAAYITDDEVIVRTLPKKTKFTTLDEQERELSDRDLMILTPRMCIAGAGGMDQSN